MRVRGFLTCLSGGGTLLLASSTYAGVPAGPVGSVEHSPLGISQVPTLGGWLLIILALLMGLVAYNKFRQQSRQGMPLVVAVLAAGAFTMAGGGVTLVNSVDAQDADLEMTSVFMTNPQGGTVELPNSALSPLDNPGDPEQDGQNAVLIGFFELKNATGVTQTINRIQSAEAFDCIAFSEADIYEEKICKVGDVLQPEELCSVACFTGDLPFRD